VLQQHGPISVHVTKFAQVNIRQTSNTECTSVYNAHILNFSV